MENLKKFAQEMGLDQEAFNSCLDTGKYTEAVNRQNEFAKKLGVQSTPSFLINGIPLVGAQPIEKFQALFEQLK